MTCKQQTKRLWKETFNDTPQFIDFYFDNIFSDDINYVIEMEGKVVSALQAIPFELKVFNKTFKVCYLSGIATDINFRNQGFMRMLLDKTHYDLKKNGVVATFLIPAENYLFGVYEKFGFNTVFYKDCQRIDVGNLQEQKNIVVCRLEDNDVFNAFKFFEYKQKCQTYGFLFSYEYFRAVVKSFGLEGGEVLIAKDSDNIVGIIFSSDRGNILKVFSDNQNVDEALFLSLSKNIGVDFLTLKTNDVTEPYGMMKVLDKTTVSILQNTCQKSLYLMLDE